MYLKQCKSLLNHHKTSLKITQQGVLSIAFVVLGVSGVCDLHASYFLGWVRSVLLFLQVRRELDNPPPVKNRTWRKMGYSSWWELAALHWQYNLSCLLCLHTLAEILWESESLKGAWAIQLSRAALSCPTTAYPCWDRQHERRGEKQSVGGGSQIKSRFKKNRQKAPSLSLCAWKVI